MAFSLFQLASMVQNNVSGGTRGQQNFTYSVEQLQDEIALERAGMLRELESAGKPMPLDACAQSINALPLRIADFSVLPAGIAELAGLEDVVCRPVLGFTHPPLLSLGKPEAAVRYVGPIGRRAPWRTAWSVQQVEYDRHKRLRPTTPLVYFDQSSPGQGWVFGCPLAQRTISVSAVLANPLLAGHYPPNRFTEESDYPLPEYLAQVAVQKLTNKYISMYGRLNARPNDGTASV